MLTTPSRPLGRLLPLAVAAAVSSLLSCAADPLPAVDLASHPDEAEVRFAVIGDFGREGPDVRRVSERVRSWDVDMIITTGDNNYEVGHLRSFDDNVGQYYCDYIYNPDAPYLYRCGGDAWRDSVNRFFPSVGNHDYGSRKGIEPYLTYFTLPGNEVYYAFQWGPVAFYALDSERAETFAEQRRWLADERARRDADGARYHVAYFHRPPYSSGSHGDYAGMQWDFDALGVDLVLAGHEHDYQRVVPPGDPRAVYIVNGAGGTSLRHDCGVSATPAEVVACTDDRHGALLVEADAERMTVRFGTAGGAWLDEVVVEPTSPQRDVPNPVPGPDAPLPADVTLSE